VSSDKIRAAVTLGIALGVNIAVTLAKGVAAGLTGSAVMAAECAHSAVDTLNQVLMGLGLWHAHRAGKAHLEYVWGVAAAVAMFFTGGVWAIYDGLRAVIDPQVGSGFVVGLVVLGVSFALEAVSFTRATTELWREKGDLGFWAYLGVTTNVTTKATFYEDGSDMVGDTLAALAFVAWTVTGLDQWDGYAAILVGAVVGCIATQIGRRNRKLWKETVAA
jgi:divalent metal cation (Fe/Co/Zn/Cd) transporter